VTINQDINGALLARLLTVSSLPAVAHEGVEDRPTTGTPYVVPTYVPSYARPRNVAASSTEHWGSFEIEVVYPMTANQGTGAAAAMADAIIAKFDPPLDLYQGSAAVRIKHASRKGAARVDANWVRLHVSIGWRCNA
jgi:hypothetical protein